MCYKLITLMNPLKHIYAVFVVTLMALPVHGQEPESTSNLVTNGNFELADANGFPADWTCSHPNHLLKCETTIELMSEGDVSFLRIVKMAASEPGVGWQNIKIPEGTAALRIAAKMRGKSIVRGVEEWQVPGVGVTYFYGDEDSAKPGQVGKWLKLPTGDSEWEVYETIIPVRDGATEGRITIIGQFWTGTFDITDLVVEPVQ